MTKKNLLIIIIVILISIIPFYFNKNAEFGGADGAATEFIAEINPNYKPWFTPIWVPPSGEIESLLFSLQAAIGSGFIFYFFGYYRGKKKGNDSINVTDR